LLVDRYDSLNAEIILICRSGNRSLDAGNALIKKGFKNIAHITTGFVPFKNKILLIQNFRISMND
jgi:rhodanese-related sulfurtransferase